MTVAKWITGLLVMIATTTYAGAEERCSYTGTKLDFESAPGKVCVNNFSPQFKPEYLEFVTAENRDRLDARKSEIGSNLITKEMPDGCVMEFVMMISQDAYLEHCHKVDKTAELKLLWVEATSLQEMPENYIAEYKLQTSNPDFAGLTAKLKQIVRPATTLPTIDLGISAGDEPEYSTK